MAENDFHTVLPRPLLINGKTCIQAPTESSFVSQFGSHLPPAQYLPSAHGTTAFYDFPPSVSEGESPVQHVLFIHGLGTPALGMIALAKAVHATNPRVHLVLYDLWGHGLSDTPLVPHTPGLFHSQIFHLLARMGWAKAHIVGYSFGGVTAATFTAFHSQLVESVTLIAPAGLVKSNTFTEEELKFLQGGDGVDEGKAGDWILNYVSGNPLVIADDWKERFARGEISGGPIQAWARKEHGGHRASVVGMARDGRIYDMQEVFAMAAKSGKRTLAVVGELDSFCTEGDLKELGWSDVVVVKEAGHALVRERVTEVAVPINTLLKSLV